MAKIGFYAGSFSPVTRGHLSIVCEALNDYEKVIVGIGVNGGKKQEYTLDERRLMVDMSVNDLLFEYKNRCLTGRSYSCSEMAAFKRLLAERDSVSVVGYQGLTVDYALRCGATALIRGERIVGDHDGEMQASLLNKQILEVRKAHLSMATIPVPREDMTYVSSSNVRSLCALGEYVAARRYVTSSVHAFLMLLVRIFYGAPRRGGNCGTVGTQVLRAACGSLWRQSVLSYAFACGLYAELLADNGKFGARLRRKSVGFGFGHFLS